MPTVKKLRYILVFLAAAVTVAVSCISASRSSECLSAEETVQACGSVISDGISGFCGFSISASETQVQIPRNTTFSPSPRQHSTGKRNWQSGVACALLKGGKVLTTVSAGQYMSSMELFPSSLADHTGRFLLLKKLII